jgi:hypothetical protein
MVFTQHELLLLVGLFWLILIPIMVFVIRMTCSLFRLDLPSYPRAALILFVVGPMAYLTFDFCSYVIMRSIQGEYFPIPPGYSYAHWFHEPLLLKWRILSLVPLMRFLPIVFALCVGGVLEVLLLQLQVNFRVGLLLCLVQWAANLIILVVFSIVFNFALGAFIRFEENDQLAHPKPQLSVVPHAGLNEPPIRRRPIERREDLTEPTDIVITPKGIKKMSPLEVGDP